MKDLYKQENFITEYFKVFTAGMLILIGLVITHELGHLSGYLIFNIDFKFFLLEEAVYMERSFGLAIGFMRWIRLGLFEELYIRILGPVLFNLVYLLILYRFMKFEKLALIFYLLSIPIFLYGDLMILFIDIEQGLLGVLI